MNHQKHAHRSSSNNSLAPHRLAWALATLLTPLASAQTCTPTLAGGYATSDLAVDVEVVGSLAYVTDRNGGLYILDIADPANPMPTMASPYAAAGQLNGLSLDGGLAYMSVDSEGIEIVDVSDPAAPVQVGLLDTPGAARDNQFLDGYLYVPDEGSLQIIDVVDPRAPFMAGSVAMTGLALDVVVCDGIAYVATDTAGLTVVDASDPAAPFVLAVYGTPGRALGVAKRGDTLCIADRFGGLLILDVTDPAAPAPLGTFPTDPAERAQDVQIVCETAVVAYESGIVRFLDISDPGNPTPIGEYVGTDGEEAIRLAVSGEIVYVAFDGDGLVNIDAAGCLPDAGATLAARFPSSPVDVFSELGGIRKLQLVWSEPVELVVSDIEITDGAGVPVVFSVARPAPGIADITLWDRLEYDTYTITVLDSAWTVSNGEPIDGDADGCPGGALVFEMMHRCPADIAPLAKPDGIRDLDDVNTFIDTFLNGCD